MRMRGKVAIVTGAGSGIGRTTALRLAEEGSAMVCADVALQAADATARAIAAAGGEAFACQTDVTDEAACARLVGATLERFGRLTTLVNAAGVRPIGPDRAPAGAEWRRVIDCNLTGTYFVSSAALAALEASGAGSITNLSSIFGLVAGSMAPSYAASKGGITNLTRQLALQWAPAVRVNCVCPGIIETPLTAELRSDAAWLETVLPRYPLRRFGKPEEVASAILFLASDEAAYITGVALPLDGGYTAI